MEIAMELPLDADGFLRRECPNCQREFKWHHGPTADAPEGIVYPPVHWCPLCGRSAALDSWWTQAQIEYQQGVLAASAGDILADAFKAVRSDHLRLEVNRSAQPAQPDPLVEPDDMVIVAPPCHPWEPVKVPDEARGPFFCLLCGEAFAV
ncbi:hypothetical protein SPF06_21565 [Sinomonas sp. JGH33]|uniref:Uncharacterized protein n=1 Tax=Sinomonas terricola TaxID=3110330 RepID=A0ABU5TC96_9MICC|nr:hypothetical protein [Sinomonas sp. JGH33]MEA5457314.1 hypothetical protein [Sinomonas sp. JGH33]